MTTQEAIERAREFSNSNKDVLPQTTEAIDTLISVIEIPIPAEPIPDIELPDDEEIRKWAQNNSLVPDEDEPGERVHILMYEGIIKGAKWMRDKIVEQKYPSEEEIRNEAEKSDTLYDEVDNIVVNVPRMSEDEAKSFIEGALWMLNKWKESK